MRQRGCKAVRLVGGLVFPCKQMQQNLSLGTPQQGANPAVITLAVYLTTPPSGIAL